MNIKSVFHCLSYINKIDASSIHAPRPGKEVPQQSHTCYEVVFYDNGCSGVTEIDGVEYKFNSGDIAFIHKNVLHSEKHFSDGTLYFFGFDVIDDKAFYIPKNGVYSNVWDIKPIIYTMFKEQINQTSGYIQMISLKTEELLLMLHRKDITSAQPIKNLDYVRNYISENYMQNISIDFLAKMTGYSTAHFRDLFTEAYGISPKSYLISVRCMNAVHLLHNTDLSCTEISYRCGFSNSAQMTVMIKNKYNKTPLQLRKNKI